MTEREALKLALEALESAEPKYTKQRADQKTLGGSLDYWKLAQHQRLKAVTAIKEVLAQPEQEPVVAVQLLNRLERQWHRMGELWERCQGKGWPTAESDEFTALRDEKTPANRAALIALLTTPPQRTWVGLNWDDLPEIYVGDTAFLHGAKWAEAKLREKNSL